MGLRGGRALPAFLRSGQRRSKVARIILLALAASLVGCSPGEHGSVFVSGGGQTTQPVASTESLGRTVGCAHIARLLHDLSAPVSDLVRRRAECPADGAPGWIVVRDEQAFRNYEDIGRNIRSSPRPPAVAGMRPMEPWPVTVERRTAECARPSGRRSRCRPAELASDASGSAPRRRARARAQSPARCESCALDADWSPP